MSSVGFKGVATDFTDHRKPVTVHPAARWGQENATLIRGHLDVDRRPARVGRARVRAGPARAGRLLRSAARLVRLRRRVPVRQGQGAARLRQAQGAADRHRGDPAAGQGAQADRLARAQPRRSRRVGRGPGQERQAVRLARAARPLRRGRVRPARRRALLARPLPLATARWTVTTRSTPPPTRRPRSARATPTSRSTPRAARRTPARCWPTSAPATPPGTSTCCGRRWVTGG